MDRIRFVPLSSPVFTPFPVLETENLVLRQLEKGDEELIFTLRTDAEVNKYIDKPKTGTIHDASDFISKINNGIRAAHWIY